LSIVFWNLCHLSFFVCCDVEYVVCSYIALQNNINTHKSTLQIGSDIQICFF